MRIRHYNFDKYKLLTVVLCFSQVVNKCKPKQTLIDSSFQFTVSSKNKLVLIVSDNKLNFKRKNKLTENRISIKKIETHKCQASVITKKKI